MKRLFLLSLAVSLLCCAAPALGAPVRSVDTIAWAIGVDHGHLSVATRRAYARALRTTARRYDFDPFTAVALIWHESRFRAHALGDHGQAVGLAQIHYAGLCDDEASCARKRAQLLDPLTNIAVMGKLIDGARAYCRRVTHKPALLSRWLHAYGYAQSRTVRCNMTKTKHGYRDRPVPTELKKIIRYRKRLLSLLQKRRAAHRRAKR